MSEQLNLCTYYFRRQEQPAWQAPGSFGQLLGLFYKARASVLEISPFVLDQSLVGEHGSRSGENTRLPSMWPGFQSRRRRHMWVKFVFGSFPCFERVFSGYSGFSPLYKNHHFQIKIRLGTVDEKQLCVCAASLTIIPRARMGTESIAHEAEGRMTIDSNAMRARGIIVLLKSNQLVKNVENKKNLAS